MNTLGIFTEMDSINGAYNVPFVFAPIYFVPGGVMLYLFYLYLFTYTCFHHDFHISHDICVFCSSTTGATSAVGTAYPSAAPGFILVFYGVHIIRSLVFDVVFVINCPFFFYLSLYCLSFGFTSRYSRKIAKKCGKQQSIN